MKLSNASLLCLCALLVCGLGIQVTAQETSALKYKAVKKWNLIAPAETWTTVSGAVAIPHANGSGFTAQPDGLSLEVDRNGDGKIDSKVKGVGGFLKLKGKDSNGKKFTYAVRMKKQGKGWAYASSGYTTGKVKGAIVRLVDLNNNGSFNEFGTDGMIIGKGNAISYLSKVVNLKGELFKIDVTRNGKQITTNPYTGETGTLNVRRGFKSKGKLVSAVVTHDSGDYSFDLASAKHGMRVPVGNYVLSAGYATAKSESVRMRAGRMKPVKVTKDETSVLEWGASLKAEFTYTRAGDKITIPPSSLKYFGKSGVEFYGWAPDARSPVFVVTAKGKKSEIDSGRFGSC
jgi:hypothetical protein